MPLAVESLIDFIVYILQVQWIFKIMKISMILFPPALSFHFVFWLSSLVHPYQTTTNVINLPHPPPPFFF